MTYARETSVPVRKSRMEIEDMLTKFNASRTFTAQEEGRAVVGFVIGNRAIQFELEVPRREDFTETRVRGRKVRRSQPQIEAAWEQACRVKWRALVLALKSKFVSIETGIETTEQAFLAHIVIPGPDGRRSTVHRWMSAQLSKAYEGGLPLLGTGESNDQS